MWRWVLFFAIIVFFMGYGRCEAPFFGPKIEAGSDTL